MKHVIYRPLHRDELGDIMPKKTELRITTKMVQVPLVAGNEIIDGQDLMTFLQKPVGQMGPQEAGPACHHTRWHSSGLERIPREGKPTTGVSILLAAEF